MNEAEKLFEFMQFLEAAKKTLRYETSDTVIKKDSVASHTWQAAVMNHIVVKNTSLWLDALKVIKLTLIHDFAETLTWNDDYKQFYLWLSNRDDKYKKWVEVIKKITEILPESSGQVIFDLWDEYSSWASKEAIFIKAAEKMESMSFLLYHWSSYIDIPEKAVSHPQNAMLKYPWLKGYHAWFIWKLKDLYIESGIPWKEEYEVQWEFEEFNDFDKIFSFFQLAQKLKETIRYDSSPLIQEKDTAAEHIFRLSFMVMVTQDIFKLDIDILRALEIALFHEIYGAITWDIDNIKIYNWEMTKEQKLWNELNAMAEIRSILPENLWNEIFGYWQEYENWETKEAKLVKALDKLESISHLLYHTHTNFDEPDMIAMYCDKTFEKIPEINPLLKILKKRLKEEYAVKWWEWKAEYDLV
ncbi:MAG: hypothetical protein ACD_3C00196G0001 [uncultured bacterium (gcode 4)]|uniref:HD domain-containing protein n=1 Tax=uncultured bacterium (gcode 4) TaxID=1234023 RepID=K2FX28_9BACT|nr:MAG: hypothetical protein ACD_3C00196G0001 [uncultured bacterium (gcode 4)]